MNEIKKFFKTWQSSPDFWAWYIEKFDASLYDAKNMLNALRKIDQLDHKDRVLYKWKGK